MSIANNQRSERSPEKIGTTTNNEEPYLSYVLPGETGNSFANIKAVDQIPPFLMTVLSSDDHWMFLYSNGAVTCGRKNADHALFPYYPADALLALKNAVGPKTIIWVHRDEDVTCWEPFGEQESLFHVDRELSKNLIGDKVCFQEHNETLGLSFWYEWSVSARYGFVRTAGITNHNEQDCRVTVCDGVHGILPAGVGHIFQQRYSNLADAYKQSELIQGLGVSVHSLSSIPVDRPEASEALRSTVAWTPSSSPSTKFLLSDDQINLFRDGMTVRTECTKRGVKPAFYRVDEYSLSADENIEWNIVCDVAVDACDLHDLRRSLQKGNISDVSIKDDISQTNAELHAFAGRVDGLQYSGDEAESHRHLSNALLNIMRGGIPLDGYTIRRNDFLRHVEKRNKDCFRENRNWLEILPQSLQKSELLDECRRQSCKDIDRIATEFLPLTLSRRHGDPSRPWNSFSIPSRNKDGERQIGFEGNWRDVFQNWEALADSFPQLLEGMVYRFVNASTVDGYNPYRIQLDGIDWEQPDPNDPWATIGYWGDHQIIYLHRLLSRYRNYFPENLRQDLTADRCVYVDVPYRLKPFEEILKTPGDTVIFDAAANDSLRRNIQSSGSDAVLVKNLDKKIHYVSLAEKLLLTSLVKVSNFVPGAGIWLSTQRPEWNDALNALAGKGASVITACHLKVFLERLDELFEDVSEKSIRISYEVSQFLQSIISVLDGCRLFSGRTIDSITRRFTLAGLQKAAETYRETVYSGFSGKRTDVAIADIRRFCLRAIHVLEETIRGNRRSDGLYESYNWVCVGDEAIHIAPVGLMLEGQVAILESNVLCQKEVVELLNALEKSDLYRPDQDSYLLYPNQAEKKFSEKNQIPQEWFKNNSIARRVIDAGGCDLLCQNEDGGLHFASDLRNNADLNAKIDLWNNTENQWEFTQEDRRQISNLWEAVFHHETFSGRATNFYAYEGLGSIYWHMVSKLVHAVAQQIQTRQFRGEPVIPELKEHFFKIRNGVWKSKSVRSYGAFPSDPYSHTPAHAGAQQPGMTGQVKEDLLTRLLELGIVICEGRIYFENVILDHSEFQSMPGQFQYYDVDGNRASIDLDAGLFGFTFCQVPIIYATNGRGRGIRIISRSGGEVIRNRMRLTKQESEAVFNRTGNIVRIDVGVECPQGDSRG